MNDVSSHCLVTAFANMTSFTKIFFLWQNWTVWLNLYRFLYMDATSFLHAVWKAKDHRDFISVLTIRVVKIYWGRSILLSNYLYEQDRLCYVVVKSKIFLATFKWWHKKETEDSEQKKATWSLTYFASGQSHCCRNPPKIWTCLPTLVKYFLFGLIECRNTVLAGLPIVAAALYSLPVKILF